jgi:hypothetical protein
VGARLEEGKRESIPYKKEIERQKNIAYEGC